MFIHGLLFTDFVHVCLGWFCLVFPFFSWLKREALSAEYLSFPSQLRTVVDADL